MSKCPMSILRMPHLIWLFLMCAMNLACGTAGAQETITLDTRKFRAFHSFGPGGTVTFTSDAEAQAVVDRITRFLPLMHPVKAFLSDDFINLPNAIAGMTEDRRRVIGFNRAFMARIRAESGTHWTLIGVAAHEVGHHVGRHALDEDKTDCPKNIEYELEADYHAGFSLGHLGAKLDDATSTMRVLPGEATCEHPERSERIRVLGNGWQKATSGDELITSAITAPAATSLETAATRPAAPPAPAAAPPSASSPAAIKPTASPPAAPTSAASMPAAVIAKATPDSVLSNFKLRNNRDVFGHDLEKIAGLGKNECAERCMKNKKCKGFSFDRWHGWCFIKDAMPGSLLDPTSIIAVKTADTLPSVATTPFVIHKLRQKKFMDQPFLTESVPAFEACLEKCNTVLKCVAFTFAKAAKTCSLLAQTEGHFYDEGFDSGYKRQDTDTSPVPIAQAGRMVEDKGKYFKGDGYSKHDDVGAKTCDVLCIKDKRCVAIEYAAKPRVCRLYAKVEPALADSAASVSYKRTN